MAELQLPKLVVRVRFPSLALLSLLKLVLGFSDLETLVGQTKTQGVKSGIALARMSRGTGMGRLAAPSELTTAPSVT